MALAEYDYIRDLGRGGMGVVYLARARAVDRLEALKALDRVIARDPAFDERFQREARTAASLTHNNIVRVYTSFKDDGVPYIAMELVAGGSLRPLVGHLTPQQVVRALEDVLAAIAYVGEMNIVHRDIKPENALITLDGTVKVADFGIAKMAVSEQAGLTREGTTVGTPEYMSPEQALGQQVTPASDLYSVGCMAFELLTGRLPFLGNSPTELGIKHVKEAAPSVHEIDPNVPAPIAAWVTRLMSKAPEDRYPDAASAWEALEDVAINLWGPTWKRGTKLEPGAPVNLAEVPPQAATPRPFPDQPQRTQASDKDSRYSIFVRPPELHQLLETERRTGARPTIQPPVETGVAAAASAAPAAGPAVVTPPPAAVIQRPGTPPAVPTVPPPGAEQPAEEEEAEKRPLPVIAIILAGVAAFVVMLVVGLFSGGGAEQGDGFAVTAPSGWSAVTGVEAIPGADSGTVAVAASGAAAGEGIEAAKVPIDEARTLAERGSDRTLVRLEAGDALRTSVAGATLFILPTEGDTALVVGCSKGVDAQVCDGAATVVELDGEALAPGPTAEGAQALQSALNSLRSGIRGATSDLADASTRNDQARAANALATRYRTAATQVINAPVGALAEPARDDLAEALRGMQSAWSRYARAASGSGSVDSARGAVARAQSRVSRASAALADAGYS